MISTERLMARLARLRMKPRAPGPAMAHDGVLQEGAGAAAPVRRGPPPPLAEALSIPCPDPTAEDRARDAHQNHALRLARQEDWEALSAQMGAMDDQRAKTDGGMPVADLMAYGARADVVAAAEHALVSGRPDPDAPLLAGIEALERVLADNPDSPMIACIVALAHMDIAWAWRGTGWDIEVPIPNRDAFAAHFDRAADILGPFDAMASTSPILAGAQCALAAGRGQDTDTLVARYDTLIDLDPRNARALRAMGGHLLPRWHGSYARLELEARRAAGRTHDIWGAGAYTWVMFDAISTDPEACARIDLDFFLEGMRDILRHTRDQHIVNLLASYAANTMGATPTGHDGADYVRAQIATAAAWIARDHLTELHPMLWAHAARGFDNALRVRCPDRFAAAGYADALRYLTDLFRRDIAAGKRIVFTEHGPETLAT